VIGLLVLAPAPLALIGFGVASVADSDAWAFGQGWVVLGLVLFAGAFLIGVPSEPGPGSRWSSRG
jgi:hypothetical protein